MTTPENIRIPRGFKFEIDKDVALVLEFIILNIDPEKQLKVIGAVNELGPSLCSRYLEEENKERFRAVAMVSPQSE